MLVEHFGIRAINNQVLDHPRIQLLSRIVMSEVFFIHTYIHTHVRLVHRAELSRRAYLASCTQGICTTRVGVTCVHTHEKAFALLHPARRGDMQ